MVFPVACKPYPLSRSDIPLPQCPCAYRRPRVFSCFSLCGSLLASTWSGALWARFCLPQAPCACRRPRVFRGIIAANSDFPRKLGVSGMRMVPGADKNAPKSTGPRVHDFMNPRVNGSSDQWINGSAGERIRGSTNPRGNGSTGPGIGLGGRFGGAAPVR